MKQIPTNNDRGKKNDLPSLSTENTIKLSYAQVIKEYVRQLLNKIMCYFSGFYDVCGICKPSKFVIYVIYFPFLNKH